MKVDGEKLQKIGAGVVVLAAALIMLPGIFSFTAGLVRMALLIGGAVLIAAALGFTIIKLRGMSAAKQETKVEVETNGKHDKQESTTPRG